jgi:hypothetical protein
MRPRRGVWLLGIIIGITAVFRYGMTRTSPVNDGVLMLGAKTPAVINITAIARAAATVFALNPETFVDSVANCKMDETCHIFYHHVQKTGGSHLAALFFPVLESQKYNSKEWCCGGRMVDRFLNDIPGYCSRKFGVYEVDGPQFSDIVSACVDLYSQQQQSKQQQAVVITTFREPIQMTISLIHQICNKGFNKIKEEQQAMCKRCLYHADPAFWDHFTKKITTVFEGIEQVVKMDHPNVQVLALDNSMMDTFFDMLEKKLDETFPKAAKPNHEKTSVCNFGMTSKMMKDLSAAELMYKNLTYGV